MAVKFNPFTGKLQWYSSGTTTFLGLTDTPSSFSGNSLKFVRVNSDGDSLEFHSGAEVWSHGDLDDMPDAAGTNSDHDARYYTEAEVDAALGLKVPYTGATGRVDLSAATVTVPNDAVGANAGDIRYNSSDVALEYYDGSGWHDAGSPKYVYIEALAQSEGDLHLSDGTNWNTSKALIKQVRVVTSSTDWDLWILQNDSGYAADDATIQKQQLVDGCSGDLDLPLDLAYEDEDASKEVHLYFVDNSGSNTADITVQGVMAR